MIPTTSCVVLKQQPSGFMYQWHLYSVCRRFNESRKCFQVSLLYVLSIMKSDFQLSIDRKFLITLTKKKKVFYNLTLLFLCKLNFIMKHWLSDTHWIEKVVNLGTVGEWKPSLSMSGQELCYCATITGSQRSKGYYPSKFVAHVLFCHSIGVCIYSKTLLIRSTASVEFLSFLSG